MDRQNHADDRGLVVRAVTAGLFLVALAVIPTTLGMVGPFAALGPSATAVAWLPALFYLLGALLPLAVRATGRSLGTSVSRIESTFGLLARASIVLLVARSLTDPSGRSLLQQLIGVTRQTGAPVLLQVGTFLLFAAAAIAALPVVVWFLAELVTSKPGSNSGTRRGESLAEQSTKWLQSKAIRVTWALFPIAIRAGLKLLAAVAYVCVAGLVWVVYGIVGLRLLTTSVKATSTNSFRGQLVGVAAMFRAAITANATFGGVFTRRVADVYRDVVSITRVGGKITGRQDWRLANDASPALRELNEFTRAVVIAYDTALNVGRARPAQGPSLGLDGPDSSGMPRPAAPRYAGYEITVSRAWSTDAYHAIVVRVSPPPAAEDAAKLTSARLTPLIDSHSSWTATELSDGLSLSDVRLRTDAHREGQTGLFITLARSVSAEEAAESAVDEPPSFRDKVTDAIRQGLVDKKFDPGLFRPLGAPERDEEHNVLIYRFATGHWTQNVAAGQIAARQELIETWRGLRDAIRFFAGIPDERIHFGHDDAKRQFVLMLDVDAPPFPGDAPNDPRTSLYALIRDNLDEFKRRPGQFVIGLNGRGQKVWIDLNNPTTAHLIAAGQTGSGKTLSAFASPLAQLAAGMGPDRLHLVLADSGYGELSDLLADLPHLKAGTAVRVKQATDLVPLVEWMEEEAERRMASKLNYKWTPESSDALIVFAIEEYQALKDLAQGNKEQEAAMEIIDGKLSGGAAKYRKTGFRFFLLSQKATRDVIESKLKLNLPIHVTGNLPAADVQLLHEEQSIAGFPGPVGRMAVSGIPQAPRQSPIAVQGFADLVPPLDAEAGDRGLRKVVRDLIVPLYPNFRTPEQPDGPRARPANGNRPKAGSYASPFIDLTPDDEDDDQESDDDWADLESVAPARVIHLVNVDYDEALPPMPAASDFAPSADDLTFARGVLRLAYRYNAGHDRWQPISQSRVDDLIRTVPGRDTSVRIERISQALRLLTNAGVLMPIATSLRGERQLHILNWRDAEEMLSLAATEEEAA